MTRTTGNEKERILTVRIGEHQSAQGRLVRMASPEIAVIDAGGREVTGRIIGQHADGSDTVDR